MPDPGIDHDQYVTRAEWRGACGRPDAIDEIADQFERPVADATAEREERLAS